MKEDAGSTPEPRRNLGSSWLGRVRAQTNSGWTQSLYTSSESFRTLASQGL